MKKMKIIVKKVKIIKKVKIKKNKILKKMGMKMFQINDIYFIYIFFTLYLDNQIIKYN